MSLIKLKHRYDFGHDWYFQFLNTDKHFPKPLKDKSIIQCSVSWMSEPCSPYLQVSCGNRTLFSIMFWAYKFGFDLDIFAHTWNFNRLEELEELDENKTELV